MEGLDGEDKCGAESGPLEEKSSSLETRGGESEAMEFRDELTNRGLSRKEHQRRKKIGTGQSPKNEGENDGKF